MDPLVLLTDVDRATEELLRTVEDLDPASVGAPSRLPGWTIGHVLSHLARNADGQTNLLTWARTGVVTPKYASPEARGAGIEAGAGRPLREQVEDLRASHERFADAAAAMTAEAWTFVLPEIGRPAAAVPWSRLREVEVHHVDLGDRYTPADWSDAFALRLLREIVADSTTGDWPAMILRPWGTDHALTIGPAPEASAAADHGSSADSSSASRAASGPDPASASRAASGPDDTSASRAASGPDDGSPSRAASGPDDSSASRAAGGARAADTRPVIGGPTKSLAAWLAGRADGADLTVSPDGELPVPARWM